MSSNKLCVSRNPSDSSLNNYECSVLHCDKSERLDAEKKEEDNKSACEDVWISHIQRIENLSKTRRKNRDVSLCECCYGKQNSTGKKVPLEKLLPRIARLSQPKRITPKYVKPREQQCKSKKIVDWEAHERWLEKRAKPKEFHPYNYCTICPKPKQLSKEGWRRLACLAQPKARVRPKSRLLRYRQVRFTPTARINELCQPKCVTVRKCPASNLKISSSAMTYQASERVKQLAMPKYCSSSRRNEYSTLPCGGGLENSWSCCCRSLSLDNLYSNEL